MKTPQEIFTDRMTELGAQEIDQIRRFVGSVAYEKYLRAVSAFKPSANCGQAGSGTRDQFSNERAAARLAEMRGWELHEAALHNLLFTVEMTEAAPLAEFPDAGLMIPEHPLPPAEKKTRKRKIP